MCICLKVDLTCVRQKCMGQAYLSNNPKVLFRKLLFFVVYCLTADFDRNNLVEHVLLKMYNWS